MLINSLIRILSFSSLTPLSSPEGLTFSEYELVYSFGHAHRLQTLAAEIGFEVESGAEIDCAAAKITPDIGTAASTTLTYIPAVVMVLVGVASWQRQLSEPGGNSLFEYRSAWASQAQIWEAVLEVASYLRYLQFIFLAGSLSVEYPGFYQPIVSQIAWSSLLYWKGPIDHDFTYTGVEGGMYVSNASYGLEYMVQMLGFPQMPDIMLDAFINLLILVSGLLVVFLILWMITLGLDQVPLLSPSIPILILGVALSFFSLPLLAYMSYELILIGYLPNYRVTLVALMMAVLVCLNYLIIRYFANKKEPGDTSPAEVSLQDSRSTGPRELVRYISHFLPHAMPLLQGIVIGGLQDWGLVQLLVLGGCEIVILFNIAIQRHAGSFMSNSFWSAVVRLLTISLSIAFACPSSEAAKQWVGYLILCLHGVMVILGFFFISLWQLCGAARKRISAMHNRLPDHREHSDSIPVSYQKYALSTFRS